jgi:hypothetical protein
MHKVLLDLIKILLLKAIYIFDDQIIFVGCTYS